MAEGGAPLGDPTVDMDSDAVACLATFSAKFEKAYKTYKQKSADLHGISRFVKAEALKVISLERIEWVAMIHKQKKLAFERCSNWNYEEFRIGIQL